MTGTAQVPSIAGSKTAFLRGVQPTAVGSPDAAARKMLQTRRASEPTLPQHSNQLPEEAQGLKDLLLNTPSLQQHSRFSFSRLKRVVVPPVQIPRELDTPNAISNIVAGSKVAMTRAMNMRRRARMMQRLPGRIDERVAW
jgi:hypothetical protein